ncbi:3123_t:CDS:2, partial [Diversispora eburnea]
MLFALMKPHMKKEIKRLETEITKKNGELGTIQTSKETETNDLNEQITSLKEDHERETTLLNEKITELEKLGKQVEEQNTTITSLKKHLTDERKDHKITKDERDKFQTGYNNGENTVNYLINDRDNKKIQLLQKEAELTRATTEKETLETSLAERTRQLNEKQAIIDNLNEEVNRQKVAREETETDRDNSQAKLATAIAEHNANTAKNQSAQALIDEQTAHKATNDQLTTANDAKTEAETQLNDYQNKLEDEQLGGVFCLNKEKHAERNKDIE